MKFGSCIVRLIPRTFDFLFAAVLRHTPRSPATARWGYRDRARVDQERRTAARRRRSGRTRRAVSGLTHSLAGKRRGTILYAFDLLERD